MQVNLDFLGDNASFQRYYFDDIILKANLKNAVFSIDTMYAHFPKLMHFDAADLFNNVQPQITLKAGLDLRNYKKPEYYVTTQFKALNLVDLIGMKDLPEYLTGDLSLEGSGFNVDSLEFAFSSNIEEAAYKNKSLMPFTINMDLKRYNYNHRRFSIQSSPLSLLADGNFKFSNIISLVKEQVSYVTEFAMYSTSSLTADEKDKELKRIEHKKQNFEPFSFDLLADIKDISIINDFLGGTKLTCNAYLDCNVDVSQTKTIFNIDSLMLRNFEYIKGDNDILITPMTINGNLDIEAIDSVFQLNNFDVKIVSKNYIKVNDLMIAKPCANFSIHNDYLLFAASSKINNLFDFGLKGTMYYNSKSLDLTLDSLDIIYKNLFRWTNVDTISAQIAGNSYKLNHFKVARENAETIEASGEYTNETFTDTKLEIKNFPIDQINKFGFISGNQTDIISGKIKDLTVNLNGTLAKPQIDLSLATSVIEYNKVSMGMLSANLKHSDQKISGTVEMFTPDTTKHKKTFECSD